MKDIHKNMVAMVIIGIIVAIISHYFLLDVLTFPLLIVCIVAWLIVSPFKITDEDDKQD